MMNPPKTRTPRKTRTTLGAVFLCLSLTASSRAGDAAEDLSKSIDLLTLQSDLQGTDKVGAGVRDLTQAAKAMKNTNQTPDQVREELARSIARSKDRTRLDLLERLNAPDLNSHPDALRDAGAGIGALAEAAQHALVVRVAAMADDASETAETRRDAYRLLGSWLPSLQGEATRALSFDAALSPLRAGPSEGRGAYRFEAIVGLTGSLEAAPARAAEEDALARLLVGVLDDSRAARRERQASLILLKKLLAARPAVFERDAANGGAAAQAVARSTPPATPY